MFIIVKQMYARAIANEMKKKYLTRKQPNKGFELKSFFEKLNQEKKFFFVQKVL